MCIRDRKEGHVRIPEDIAVIGYDDNSLSKLISPELTTIAQPKSEMAARGTQMLIKMIDAENMEQENLHIVLEPNLIIRESTMRLA